MMFRNVVSVLFCMAVLANGTEGSLLRQRKLQEHESDASYQFDPRIVGGEDAPETRFPYYVALLNGNRRFVCGGTLISSDVVLTAAHCNIQGDLEYALIGKYEYGFLVGDHEQISIATVVENPDFDFDKKRFDQLLIKLEKPSSKQAVRLNLDPDVPLKQGENVTVIGLGRLEQAGARPDVLQQVTIGYVTNEVCEEATYATFSYEGDITDDMICVRGKEKGQCNGDSGGPYLLLGDSAKEDIQVGVVSWGVGCAFDEFSGVGSRTSASDFIQTTTCDIAEDPPAYLCGTNEEISVPITLSIFFDPNPEEVSWKIIDMMTQEVVAETTPGTYSTDFVVEQVFLIAGNSYTFTISDSEGNGMIGSDILYDLTLRDAGIEIQLIQGDGNYGTERVHEFRVPTSDEYPTPVPIFPTSSPAPTPLQIRVFVQIQFDDWHEEVSWTIAGGDFVYGEASEGTYRHGDNVTEEVFLPPDNEYIFTIRDRSGNGIDVEGYAYRVGLFNSTGDFVSFFEGRGDFLDEAVHTFFVSQEAEVTVDVEPSCSWLFEPCLDDSDCCSNRCLSSVCRTSSNGGSKTSIVDGKGGAAGANRRPP